MAKGVSFKGAENVVMVYNPVNKLKHSELYTLKIILRLPWNQKKKGIVCSSYHLSFIILTALSRYNSHTIQ